MIKRVISGICMVLIAALILYINNPIIYNICITVLSLIGMYEFYRAFKNIHIKPIESVGYISCLVLMLIGGVINKAHMYDFIRSIVPVSLIVIFCYMLFAKNKRNIIDVAITLFSMVYIPLMFSFIKYITLLDDSNTYINEGTIILMYGFIGAFATDTFAYIIGKKFGKNKLCPEISPNKTVEGSIGGLIGSVLCIAIFTLIVDKFFGLEYSMWYMILIGIVVSLSGQLGDLGASAIKRYTGIKDFGTLIPGHGGILDRLDSLLFVMPIIYIFMK